MGLTMQAPLTDPVAAYTKTQSMAIFGEKHVLPFNLLLIFFLSFQLGLHMVN